MHGESNNLVLIDRFGEDNDLKKKSSKSKSTRANESIEMSTLSKLEPGNFDDSRSKTSVLSKMGSFFSLNSSLRGGKSKGLD